MPARRPTPPSTYDPAIVAEAERVVRKTVADCKRIAARKELEIGFPRAFKMSTEFNWRAGSWNWGGYRGVTIGMQAFVPKKNPDAVRALYEYRSIADEPAIGNLPPCDWRIPLACITAHEMAHVVQQWVKVHRRGTPLAARCKLPHGHGWRQLYARFRKELKLTRRQLDL